MISCWLFVSAVLIGAGVGVILFAAVMATVHGDRKRRIIELKDACASAYLDLDLALQPGIDWEAWVDAAQRTLEKALKEKTVKG